MAGLKVVTSPLSNSTKDPLALASPPAVRQGSQAFGEVLARDLENVRDAVNGAYKILRQATPQINQIYVTDATGATVAVFGDKLFQGVMVRNYLSELHVGGAGDPTQAILNVNPDGTATIGETGSVAVLDPFGAESAWIGSGFDNYTVVSVSSGAAGVVRLEITGHTLLTGDVVKVAGVPNGTGMRTVTYVDATHVDLDSTVYIAGYASGGYVDRLLHITGAADNGAGLIRLMVVAHGYESGDTVDVKDVGGIPGATGQWVISAYDVDHFDLADSTFAGAFTTGGICLRYFAGMLAQTFAIGSSFTNYKLRAFADGSLKIINALISLIGSGGAITLNPDVPEITLVDPSGTESVNIGITQEAPLAITIATNTSPAVLTVPTNTYVDGDTIFVTGETGNTAINGYRIVQGVGISGAGTFTMTTLAGVDVDGNGVYAGSATAGRYYGGILAQIFAIGESFANYKMRLFADGSLKIKDATFDVTAGTMEIKINATDGFEVIDTLVQVRIKKGKVTSLLSVDHYGGIWVEDPADTNHRTAIAPSYIELKDSTNDNQVTNISEWGIETKDVSTGIPDFSGSSCSVGSGGVSCHYPDSEASNGGIVDIAYNGMLWRKYTLDSPVVLVSNNEANLTNLTVTKSVQFSLDATYDIGKSSTQLRPRNLYLSGFINISGSTVIAATGAITFLAPNVGNFTFATDGYYNIGGASANRPKDVNLTGLVNAGTGVTVAGNQVVGARATGWNMASGVTSRATFDTATVTTEELAKRVKTLLDDLFNHGLIGT